MAAPAPGQALSAEHVRFGYGDVAVLDDVTLEVGGGRCVALVGESGAGKTTLLRCFNRMIIPATGIVRIDGSDISRQPVAALRRRIGYVQQHGGLLPHWTVLRNIALVPELLNQPDTAGVARRALEQVGLPAAIAARYPNQLSGGQRQRVALARAIAARPDVLLMDEPFGALDAISRSDLQTLFADLRAQLAITTILVTHDLAEAGLLADELVVMRAGRIEQRGPLDSIVASPSTPYVASLIARALHHPRATA